MKNHNDERGVCHCDFKTCNTKKHHDNELHSSCLGFRGSYNEKNQYDELQLVILVLEARTLKRENQDNNHPSSRGNNNETKKVGKKNTYLQSFILLDGFQAPTFGVAPSLHNKFHKLHKFLPSSSGGANLKPNQSRSLWFSSSNDGGECKQVVGRMGMVDGLGDGKEVGGVSRSSQKKIGFKDGGTKTKKQKRGMGEKMMKTRKKNKRKKKARKKYMLIK